MTCPPKSDDKGAALIVVLWVALFVSGTLLLAQQLMRSEIQIASSRLVYLQNKAAAKSALAEAAYRVAMGHQKLRSGVTRLQSSSDDHKITIEITPETGKVDINFVDPILIQAIAKRAKFPEDGTETLVHNLQAQRREQNRKDNLFSNTRQILMLARVEDRSQLACLLSLFTIYTQRPLPYERDANLLVRTAMHDLGWGKIPLHQRAAQQQELRARSGQFYTFKVTLHRGHQKSFEQEFVVQLGSNRQRPFQIVSTDQSVSMYETDCDRK